MQRLKFLLEYAAARVTESLFTVLPHRAALVIAWCFAWLIFHVIRFRRAEAMHRIKSVFGDTLTRREVTQIAWLSWRNICFNAAEMMRVTRLSPSWLRTHAQGVDAAVTRVHALIDTHGGVIIAVPHMGNWELAGVACKQNGIDIFSLTGKQKNPYVNRWMNRIRSYSMDVVERGGPALRTVLRRLKNRGAFAILPDVRMPKPDLSISFLGTQANLGRGMAQFARTAKVPIALFILSRVGWSHHAVTLHQPVFADLNVDRETDLNRMTQTVMGHIDDAIRQHPEQWFWYNKRWVLRPLGQKSN